MYSSIQYVEKSQEAIKNIMLNQREKIQWYLFKMLLIDVDEQTFLKEKNMKTKSAFL